MITNFNRFLRDKLDNQKNTYTHFEGEIYRHSANVPFEKALSENNFVVVGESFFDMDDHILDENDLFFLNTFKFYNNAKFENNLVMTYAEHIQSRKLFLAFLENVILIEKHTRNKVNYTLDTKNFYFSNVFYLIPNNNQLISLPFMSIKTPTQTIRHEFSYIKLQNINEQIKIINESFREHYFKHILDKTVNLMTADEKKAVIMFYQ